MRPTANTHVVVAAPDFAAGLEFFTETLGFGIDTISPADDPSSALLSLDGLTVCLDRDAATPPVTIRLVSGDRRGPEQGSLTGPNGTTVEFVVREPVLTLPPQAEPTLVVSRQNDDNSSTVGRAGMQYRDLIPDRQAGRFIASHIRIPGSGPVPDYVHFHDIRFQLIYCVRGASTLVYEDQGEPFRFEAGDCVLQPPLIRHRVLESFDDLEVIEMGSPAHHDTHVDHDLALPTENVRPDRDFGGQRFVRHEATLAEWNHWAGSQGFECRDTGISAATGGVGGVRVVRTVGGHSGAAGSEVDLTHDAELVFWFVLSGSLELSIDHRDMPDGTLGLASGDSVTLPAQAPISLVSWSAEVEFLEVRLPG